MQVFKNFLIFITIFSSLLISFVFSFNILLPNVRKFYIHIFMKIKKTNEKKL